MYHKQRWTLKKIQQRLELITPLVYRHRHPLPPLRYLALNSPLDNPPIAADLDDTNWQPITAPGYWSHPQTNFVLRTTFQVPADWPPAEPIALFLPLSDSGDFSHPEALAYIDGEAYATCDRHHQEIILPGRYRDSLSHTLALHGWTGLGSFANPEQDKQLWLRPCQLVQIDTPLRQFVATARVALEVAQNLGEQQPERGLLLNALEAAFIALDSREPFGDEFYASVPAAHQLLRQGIEQAGRPLDVHITAVGHAHIDVAWLWTLGQTRRKAGRTFHTVLRYMEQYPDYHFSQSQPQLYDYVRQDYPDLFRAIQERVAGGRWELIGGMWVEADCNLSGGESLARQFLLGRSFFREQFGRDVESPVLWLPDVFGYAWNLPQLIREAGLEYFFTIKIGWSQYNRMPYDSFWWQGLDGTRVLTHFSTTPEGGSSSYASTYNAMASPQQTIGTWTNFQQKEQSQTLLMAFGYGDGGGGPTREMLENIPLMSAFPATPQMEHGRVADFFRRLEAESGDRLPTWKGELYLEYHRGTYTTQSRNKRANRKAEFLLHDAEFLAAVAAQFDPGYSYPTGTLRHAWQLVCLNQFHDIIPGSSIHEVYVESQQQYDQIFQLGQSVRDQALATIAATPPTNTLLINPTSFPRHEPVFIPAGSEQLAVSSKQLVDDHSLPTAHRSLPTVQPVPGGYLLDPGPLPPYSVTSLEFPRVPAIGLAMASSPEFPSSLTAEPNLLENDYLRVELNPAGDITRLYDKQNGREILPPHTIANQFIAFEDRPLGWDAWDIDIFYDDKQWPAGPAESITVVESGPLRATLEIKRQILNSPYSQRLSLTYNSPRLDIQTTIDWRERHILLKVAFPVHVLAPTATYEIQWGNVERPTHRNTSWDWARFETCAHKWVDLSEGNYGVSLLNDCKYGHDIQDHGQQGGVIRLSLLRGTTMPDPQADQGQHQFSYSLFPHAGRWSTPTIAHAYTLNNPILVYVSEQLAVSSQQLAVSSKQLAVGSSLPTAHRSLPTAHSLFSTSHPNLIIETIKQAEDGNGLIIRLYESQRQRGRVTLHTAFPLGHAWRTNILEENQFELPCTGRDLTLDVRPYEIITLRLQPQN